MTLGSGLLNADSAASSPLIGSRSGIDYSLLHVYTEIGSGSSAMQITFRFYEDPPNISGGGGGFQAVQRPLNSTIVAWRGPTDSYTMELNLIMDCFTASTSGGNLPDIENDCRTLEKMAGVLVSPVVQPPLLILDANGALQNDAYNKPSLRWVISDPPTYADVDRNSNGRRIRQVTTVKFMHYSAYDELTRSKDVSQSDHPGEFKVTGAIDTFKKAAAKYPPMKNARWGSRLAQLNNKTDPTVKLEVGRFYKLPTQAQFKIWQKTARR